MTAVNIRLLITHLIYSVLPSKTNLNVWSLCPVPTPNYVKVSTMWSRLLVRKDQGADQDGSAALIIEYN